MIRQIADIVKIIIDCTTRAKRHHEESLNKADKIALLKSYFLLVGIHNDGEILLGTASPTPEEQLKTLSSEALEHRLQTWDAVLRRQGSRLYKLNAFIANRSDLTLISPRSQRQLKIIIGSKLDRVSNLFELGAGLFFRTKLSFGETPETIAKLATKTLNLDSTHPIDAHAIGVELRELWNAIEDYRCFVMSSMSVDDIRLLSPIAKSEAEQEA